MSFDQQQFEALLNTSQFGRPCYFFDTLPSTNDTLWNLIDQGASPGTVVIAAQQQSGRGQWGRHWQSPPGGLYLSVAIASKIPANQSTQLTLWSAWGIATILRSYSIPVWLKWPNDVLLYGRKLGGILTETRLHQGQITIAVIGIGLNWGNPVPESGINLQAALITQPHLSIHSLEELAAITLEGLELGYQRWQTLGIKSLLPDYLAFLQQMEGCSTMENIGGQGNRIDRKRSCP
jgi:BirA family biotin operon repressor/biotin-[acetyl-CoA-carboxylase] ligase